MLRPSLLARFALVTIALFGAISIPVAVSHAQATIVLLVRHGEKSGPTGDVPLSAAGQARAEELSEIAREAGVGAIITTQFQRTRQTAAPAAAALGITGQVIAAQAAVPEHANAVADAVRERFSGKTVLIVGHSNTVPAIVSALGGPKLPDICDAEYDHLYVMVLSPGAPPRLVHSRYGAKSESEGKCEAMMR